MTRPHLLDALRDQVLLCDGGMGSRVQALTLDIERDYWNQENCTEVLNLSRPDLVREIHRGYFEAGADMVETNTFGGSTITLAEFGLGERAFEINKVAAELAREAAETFADGRDRYVIGSIGPGTKLPTLGNIAYDPLEEALAVQCRGLIAGGVDAILIETCQDTLQIKAAVNAAKLARLEAGTDTPVFVQVTVETTGTLLVGPDIAAAATVIHALDVPLIGLNCATGPQEMGEHIRWLAANWPGLISVQPNAGLPELVDGKTHYPLDGAQMATWMERYVLQDGLNLIGGCCGTSTPHIQALDAMLSRIGKRRPAPVARKPVWIPSVASLYGQTALRQENSYFSIGERCNANGSKKWRQLQESGDWDGCVSMGSGTDCRGVEQPGRLHGLRRAERDDGDERGDHAVHLERELAFGDRQHGDAGDRSGAEAAWRKADHQLDQLRRWGASCSRSPHPREEVRGRGDRVDDRRDRDGENA